MTSNPLCANHSTRDAPALPKIPSSPNALPKPCGNSGTTKCSNLACKACCATLRSLPGDEGSTFKCEFHEDKELKAKVRSDELKAHKERQKQKGKQKAMENQARDKELAEQRRREREERKKQEQQGQAAERTA